ncbi:hypothetical protein [Bacillus timonensis]|uniref:hypothetical protein n=1 Tax=Bacillus timonensis TaxID=1033734 RepID=UPI0002D3776C|nr:hypothetical protein [Bacillus timonensis]
MENQNKSKNSLQHDYNEGFLNNVSQTLENVADAITGQDDGNRNQNRSKKNK